jgi:hypothetical protein
MAKAIGETYIDNSNVDLALVLCEVFEACIHTAGRSHNFNISLFREDSSEGISHHVMVVAEKNTNSH